MLFLTVLLFIILSSGSLQCALNCYDSAAGYSSNTSLVADCHPPVLIELSQSPNCSFCHNGHSASEVAREPVLQSISGGHYLALFSTRCDAPDYRSAEPIEPTFAVLALNIQDTPEILPLSQNLKELRSTILLM